MLLMVCGSTVDPFFPTEEMGPLLDRVSCFLVKRVSMINKRFQDLLPGLTK